MEINASFFIGISSFVSEPSEVSNSVRAEIEKTNEVFEMVEAGDCSGQISGISIDIQSAEFSNDFATADDQEGMPILLYVDATFEVPEELEATVEDLADGELESHLKAKLTVGQYLFHAGEVELI